jgi:CheY-like chemotaxis protein
LEIFSASGTQIGLVILDMSMPEMSGKETLTRLRKLTFAFLCGSSAARRILMNSVHGFGYEIASVVREAIRRGWA